MTRLTHEQTADNARAFLAGVYGPASLSSDLEVLHAEAVTLLKACKAASLQALQLAICDASFADVAMIADGMVASALRLRDGYAGKLREEMEGVR